MFLHFKIFIKELVCEIGPLAHKEMLFKSFSIFSSGGHFVLRSGTFLDVNGTLVDGHPRYISVKLF